MLQHGCFCRRTMPEGVQSSSIEFQILGFSCREYRIVSGKGFPTRHHILPLIFVFSKKILSSRDKLSFFFRPGKVKRQSQNITVLFSSRRISHPLDEDDDDAHAAY